MTPERWKQIERILQMALECTPAERVALLERECGNDASLRSEVESLLTVEPITDSFLDKDVFTDVPTLIMNTDKLFTERQFDHYIIERQLGKGGMGDVYLAQDLRLGRKVALKILDPVLTQNEHWRARFLREARLASSLDHPNICTVHEVGEAEGRLFIAMQYVEGKTLREVVDGRPLSLKNLLSISFQLCEALANAHSRGVIHRDIKAANVIVTPPGQAKLLDFGVAKLLDTEDKSTETNLTTPGVMIGTPAAMSPEQIRCERVDYRSDIFSLGIVLYEMATGRMPFTGSTRADVISSVLREMPARAVEVNRDLPATLSDVIDRALRKNPDERYQSTNEMMMDLRKVISENGPDRPFGSTATWNLLPASSQRTTNRHRRSAAALLFALAGIVALILAGVWLYRSSRRSTQSAQTLRSDSLQKMKITRLTTVGTATGATISPDGRYIAYATGEAVPTGGFPLTRWPAGMSSLWVQQLSTKQAVQIVPPAEVQFRASRSPPAKQ